MFLGGTRFFSGLLFNDVYAASKFAVEGFCESLAVQAMKFNVKWVDQTNVLANWWTGQG